MKNPACLVERAGFERNPKFRFVNYLPSSMGSKPFPSRLGSEVFDVEWSPHAERSMPAHKIFSICQLAGREHLVVVALRIMCVKGEKEIGNRSQFVNHQFDNL